MGLSPGAPGLNPRFPGVPADQAMAQPKGGVLSFLLVAAPHPFPLVVIQQGMVRCVRDRALKELDGGAHIEQGAALQEKIGKGVWAQPGPLG